MLLQNYGYTVNPLHELLLEVKDHYNEVLMQKWVQVGSTAVALESNKAFSILYILFGVITIANWTCFVGLDLGLCTLS